MAWSSPLQEIGLLSWDLQFRYKGWMMVGNLVMVHWWLPVLSLSPLVFYALQTGPVIWCHKDTAQGTDRSLVPLHREREKMPQVEGFESLEVCLSDISYGPAWCLCYVMSSVNLVTLILRDTEYANDIAPTPAVTLMSGYFSSLWILKTVIYFRL